MTKSELHLVWTWPAGTSWVWMCECGATRGQYPDQASALAAAHTHSLVARKP